MIFDFYAITNQQRKILFIKGEIQMSLIKNTLIRQMRNNDSANQMTYAIGVGDGYRSF